MSDCFLFVCFFLFFWSAPRIGRLTRPAHLLLRRQAGNGRRIHRSYRTDRPSFP